MGESMVWDRMGVMKEMMIKQYFNSPIEFCFIIKSTFYLKTIIKQFSVGNH